MLLRLDHDFTRPVALTTDLCYQGSKHKKENANDFLTSKSSFHIFGVGCQHAPYQQCEVWVDEEWMLDDVSHVQ